MPFDIHPIFLIALLAIVLIIFGPGKLPQVGGALGRTIREFRHATTKKDTEDAAPSASTGSEEPAREKVVAESSDSTHS